MQKRPYLLTSAALFSVLALAGGLQAQDSATPADIVNDEGGPAIVTGTMNYTDPLFPLSVSEPVLLLEDQSGFVARNQGYIFPLESQVLGRFTTDFFSPPVDYVLNLPIEPTAPYNDVDHDGEDETGVQIFAVAMWDNTWGDPYLEPRDLYGGGWSGNLVTTLTRQSADGVYEVVGGDYIVYAPDDAQGFPSGFGEDGLLFTDDDPIVTLPQGYTVVNMDTDVFTFSREREPSLDLLEAESAQFTDYSDLTYVEAFDAMIVEFRERYAYTEFKELDWDAIDEEFRSQFQAATDNDDFDAYAFALRSLTWAIPDVHVGFSDTSIPALGNDFQDNTTGGFGFAIRELDDGRVMVFFVLSTGPADQAGMQPGAVVTEFNGMPIADAIAQAQPYSAPFSNPEAERYQQARYLLAAAVDTDAEITFQNPGEDAQTVTLTSVAERNSFSATSVRAGYNPPINPVTYQILNSGIGYMQITDFLDKSLFTIQLWERGIQTMIDSGVPGIIIDMRHNGGGSGWLANQMAGYFFQEDQSFGYSESFNEALGAYFRNTDSPDRFFVPQANLRYDGAVAILVGQDCVSACEFFADTLQRLDRATVYGQYPTEGGGGAIDYFLLPGGIYYQYTTTREIDLDGNIRLEGSGVVPDVRIPVTEDTIFYNGDIVLDSTIDALISDLGLDGGPSLDTLVTDGGEIIVGDTVTGEVAVGERVRYTFTAAEDASLSIILGDDANALDTYLRIYDADENIVAENDDVELGVNSNSEIGAFDVVAGDTFIIEVSTYADASAGEYSLSVVNLNAGLPASGDVPAEITETPAPVAMTPEATMEMTPEATAAPEVTETPVVEVTPEVTTAP